MTVTDPQGSDEVRRYRALASPIRARLLEALRADPDLDTATLAERVGLHVNTARSHLNLLEEAGLVRAVDEQRDRPGRPRRLYRAADPAPDAGHDAANYRFLAAVLASYLGATADDPRAAAEQAGGAWGSFVVDTPPPFRTLAPEDAIDRLVQMLEGFGFAPDLDTTDPDAPVLRLRRCPFLAVARDHADVVCSVHLGLMRGALSELGVDVEVEDLVPWAEPDTCVSRLRVPTG